MIIESIDRENELHEEIETISALLWDGEETAPKITAQAGAMIYKRIKELKDLSETLNQIHLSTPHNVKAY